MYYLVNRPAPMLSVAFFTAHPSMFASLLSNPELFSKRCYLRVKWQSASLPQNHEIHSSESPHHQVPLSALTNIYQYRFLKFPRPTRIALHYKTSSADTLIHGNQCWVGEIDE